MAYELLARFPEPAERPTAIAAFNDRTAIGVIRGCYEAGIRVPEDVALIGFHDIPTARYTTPALTTIGHPLIELGEMAAESLFTLIGGGEVAERDRTVPVSLVIRESCGAIARSCSLRRQNGLGEAPCVSTFCVGSSAWSRCCSSSA